MKNICFSKVKIAYVILIAIITIVVIQPLYAQEQMFVLEAGLGMTLFSFSDPVLKAETDLGAAQIDLTYKPGFLFGAYGGYCFGDYELGGEICLITGSGTTSDVSIAGSVMPDSAGTYDFSMFRITPVFRYFFSMDNPLIRPFAGLALGYANFSVDITDPALKFTQGYLDIALLGGAKYFFEDQIYMGGSMRLDIYSTMVKDDLSGVPSVGDINKITTDGWVPLSLNIFVGYNL